MKNQTTPQRVSLKELAKRSGYSRQAITTWTTAGILQRRNGLYDLVASLEAIRKHEKDRATEGGHVDEETRELRRAILEKKLEKLAFELSVAKGLVHSKTACCQSLLAIRAAESRILRGLAARLAAKHPEVPGLLASVQSETDETLARLKTCAEGVRFECPFCHHEITELKAIEPTAEAAA